VLASFNAHAGVRPRSLLETGRLLPLQGNVPLGTSPLARYTSDDGVDAMLEFHGAAAELYAEKQRCPVDDVMSVWTSATIDGEPLSLGDVLSDCLLLLDGGAETTRTVIARTLLELIARPDQWQALRDGADRVMVGEHRGALIRTPLEQTWTEIEGPLRPLFSAAIFTNNIRVSFHAFAGACQTADVQEEQRKLQAADAVILAFPLWWFGMPAIMKGWIDRVWAYGLAYGYRGAGNAYRYGEGGFAGKRALLAVAAGGPAIDYSPRGINGPLEQLLFPITHGTLFFPGMQVLPTFAVYGAAGIDADGIKDATLAWRDRLERLFEDAPIAFRPQNGGDYPDRHVLASHVAPGQTGLMAHIDDAPRIFCSSSPRRRGSMDVAFNGLTPVDDQRLAPSWSASRATSPLRKVDSDPDSPQVGG
jgi:NAD(P)H dehydrogenase (quinone)